MAMNFERECQCRAEKNKCLFCEALLCCDYILKTSFYMQIYNL